MIYNYRDLYGVQLQAKLSNFQVAVNHPLLLGKITHLRLLQLQTASGLANTPLNSWPVDSLLSTFKYYLPALLTLAKQHGFGFIPTPRSSNPIGGGFTPISSVTTTSQYRKLLPFLRKYSIIFVSQVVVPGTNIPFTWNGFCSHNNITSRRASALWFKLLKYL